MQLHDYENFNNQIIWDLLKGFVHKCCHRFKLQAFASKKPLKFCERRVEKFGFPVLSFMGDS